MSDPSRDALQFPQSDREALALHLPENAIETSVDSPFVTLTFATSLDSQLALSPGVQTALSGPASKAMTHYLRSKHDAILIGVGTAIADNPSLNCRLEGVGGYGGKGLEGQPRPIILDPHGRWDFDGRTKVMTLAREGKGKAPFIFLKKDVEPARESVLESVGGKYVRCTSSRSHNKNGDKNAGFTWPSILQSLSQEGIRSVMIEGGGTIINDLLHPSIFTSIDSVIVTIAPTWLGEDGVLVRPQARKDEEGNKMPVGRLKDVKWHPLGEDVVLCGKPKS